MDEKIKTAKALESTTIHLKLKQNSTSLRFVKNSNSLLLPLNYQKNERAQTLQYVQKLQADSVILINQAQADGEPINEAQLNSVSQIAGRLKFFIAK